jgi:tetratricopeptide (TPR) repeat protein
MPRKGVAPGEAISLLGITRGFFSQSALYNVFPSSRLHGWKDYGNLDTESVFKEQLQRAVRLAEPAEKDTFLLGVCSMYLGNFESALIQFQKSLAQTRNKQLKARLFYRMGFCYQKMQAPEKARNAYRKAELLGEFDLPVKAVPYATVMSNIVCKFF